MKKRFKAKKKRKFKTRLLWNLFIISIIGILCMISFQHFKLATTNEEFIKKILEDSTYHTKYDNPSFTFITNVSTFLSSINMKEPITILEQSLGFTHPKKVETEVKVEKNNQNIKMMFQKNEVEDLQLPKSPRVYIYNTHYKEGYAASNLESYNITPNVIMAAHLLKEKLEKFGIPTIVENGDLGDFMAVQNLNHSLSYEASRYFLEDAIKNNPNLELIIDLHRDALSKSASTVEIDGTSYAKILFVCGKENPNYQKNLELMKKLDAKIKAKYPTLSRGVIVKEGDNVNGVYNQDVSPNIILLECGGNENHIGEVTNTLTLIAPIIAEMLNET